MPAAVAAGIAQTALAAPVIGGGLGALGTGLALGSQIAGGGGLLGSLGLSPIGTGLGGLAPGVAANIAPAAASQLAGTVAPSLVQSALPGLQGGMGALAPGATPGLTGSALQSAGLNTLKSQALQGGLAQMPAAAGGYNPAMAQNLGAQFMQNAPPLAKPYGAETMLAEASGKVAPNAFQQAHTVSGPGLNANALQMPSLTNPTVSPLNTTTPVNPADIVGRSIRPEQNFMQNLRNISSFQDVKDYAEQHPYATSAAVGLGTQGLMKMMQQKGPPTPENNAMIRPYDFDYNATGAAYQPGGSTSEQLYFNPTYTAGEPYKADEKAEGGIASAYAVGGPVEQMSAMNSVGANTGYPMANINTPMYANPMMQRPEATNVIAPSADAGVGAYSGEPRFARGGDVGVSYGSNLGGYSDGGQLLRGPGSGVSDDIPATIAGKQPARLANNEFVIPARIVSELGNGSTEAGARQLYKMMDRVQAARKRSIGKGKVAVDTKAHKHLPA